MQSMEAMKYHLYLWTFGGIWSPRPGAKLYTLYSGFTLVMIDILLPALILLNLMTVRNMNEAIETILPLSSIVIATTKVIITIGNKAKIGRLFNILDELDTFLTEDTYREIIRKTVKESKKLIIFTCCLYFIGVSSAFGLVFTSKKRVLMWPSWVPFEYENSLVLYSGVLAYQYLANLFIVALDATMDVYGATFSKLLGSHLDILGLKMKQFKETSFNDFKGQSNKFEMLHSEKELSECIKYHQTIIEFSHQLDSTLSLHYFIQFSFSGAVICVAAFQMSLINPIKDVVKFLFLCAYLVDVSIEIFIPCFFGSIVIEKSEKISNKIYGCCWTDKSEHFKSSIKFMIKRAIKPMVPLAGGIIVISLPTFVKILRTAYSLLAFLKNYQ